LLLPPKTLLLAVGFPRCDPEDFRDIAQRIGRLAVLGVRPRHASSALGYIVPGAALDGLPRIARVSRFVEKPEAEIAASLVSSGALWNAGIVVARTDIIIAAIRKHEPDVLIAVERSLIKGASETDEIQLTQADFAAAPRISFDNAVLERHEFVAVTALDAMWRDVGTWAEVADLYPADGDGNRKNGRVQLTSSHNSFVLSPHRLTLGIGLDDLIVVDTPDALLIANRNNLGLVREAVEAMDAASRLHVEIGNEQLVTKFVMMGDGEVKFCQPHTNHSRYWIVLQGIVRLTSKGNSSTYGANESFYVPPGVSHTIANEGSPPCQLMEIHLIANNVGQV